MTNSWPRWLRYFRRRRGAAWMALGLVACAPSPQLMRTRGLITQPGRAIPADAYVFYLTALRAEADGASAHARKLYLAALEHDPKAGAVWAGLIRTTCEMPRQLHDALTSALRSADRPALALVAYAECRLDQQTPGDDEPSRAQEAEAAQRRALALEPLLLTASLGLEKALNAQGRFMEAARVRHAYELYAGSTLHPETSSGLVDRTLALGSVDKHILAHRSVDAMDAAAGYASWGEVSVRMLALGQANQALETARQVLFNEPQQADAQLVVTLACRPPEFSELTRLLSIADADRSALSPLGHLLLARELELIAPGMGRRYVQTWGLYMAPTGDDLFDDWMRDFAQ